jgi:4a-hydroxytetrahydrobiopterin dehydratase
MKAPAGWTAEKARLTRRLVLKDFAEAVRLIGEIAKLADAMDHHPDLHLTGYRNLALELTTHSAGGVTDKDYELAAKIEALPRSEKKA